MKNLFLAVLFFLTWGLFLTHSLASQSETGHASWWIKTYDVIDPKDPMVSRTHNIFNKVNAAADKQSNHFPKLILLKSAGKYNALCLPDGSVILTQNALNICYENANISDGNAKMAFIIAHELAHLSNGDFWKPPESSIKQSKHEINKDNYPSEMMTLLDEMKDDSIKEFLADDFAIVYMIMAGYDPWVIVHSKGSNFFQEWVTQCNSIQSDPKGPHLSPDQRAKLIVLRIVDIIDNMKKFDIGIRLYQLGKYKDALVFLESFCEKFPSREVFNNIGLIYYQLGIKDMAACPEQAYRFKLSTFFDPESRAGNLRISTKRGCPMDNFYHAIRYFKKACEKDSFYKPAFINYSSALIMTGQYARAIGILRDDVLKYNKKSSDALNNFAVSLYLMGPDPFIQVDMFNDASKILKNVIKSDPKFSDAYFNLGRIQDERGRYASSKENWKKFLKLEPTGCFAKAVSPSSEKKQANTHFKNITFEETIPVKFGEIDITTEKQLKGYKKQILKIGAVYCEVYSRNGVHALALDDIIEVVEVPIKNTLNTTALSSKYGPPVMTFPSLSGKKTLIFKKFAVDIMDNVAKKVIHFEEKQFGVSSG
ncbi:TPR repeat-containing protein [Candidatus Magnetomorum sp. HK-1]|nr:TPR repeat-containing protein [Candidatus Magnetomorum sp. HK-1]